MAYQTGTFNSPGALKSAIEAFATANGWALASGVLSQGASYVRLTTPDAVTLLIEGCTDATFSAPQLCPQAARCRINPWPASGTYHLHAHSAPAVIVLAAQYGVTLHQHLMFGEMAKAGSWTGGNWFFATHGTNGTSGVCENGNVYISGLESAALRWNGYSGPLFWGQRNTLEWDGTYRSCRSAHLHCELNGTLWPGAGTNVINDHPTFPQLATPLHNRIVSTADDEQVLLPYWLGLRRPDGYYSDLGHLEHVRCARLLNHAPGDLLDYGGEQWQLWPWYERNDVYPDGGIEDYPSYATRGTGLWGYAVRYDGP